MQANNETAHGKPDVRATPLAATVALAAGALWASCARPNLDVRQPDNPPGVTAPGVTPGYPVAPPDDARAADDKPGLFTPRDVFELEWASDPRISPDGRRVVYVRNAMDIMTDTRRANLWIVDVDRGVDRAVDRGPDSTAAGAHRPITSGKRHASSPRWSPDGGRIAFVDQADGKSQLHIYWVDTGQIAAVTNLVEGPGNLTWSPDGRMLAFTMFTPEQRKPMAAMPTPPEGAKWAEPPRVIDKLVYRQDGQGWVADGYTHLYVVPADGGTPRQLTRGAFHHDGAPAWTPDGKAIVLSANRRADWEYEPLDSEIYEVAVETGGIRALTDRRGPDGEPVVSPDGALVAYTGFDDRRQGYQVSKLYVTARNQPGAKPRVLLADLDRSVSSPVWSADGRGVYALYSDRGNTHIAYAPVTAANRPAGPHKVIARNVGGESIGRPYAAGSFTVSRGGIVAYTTTTPAHPADVAVAGPWREPRRLTRLNDDLLAHKSLGAVEEIWFESSYDKRKIQGWIVTPPGFASGAAPAAGSSGATKYPLVLEIHGGPFADYGDRFAAEMQLYAAAGYVVLYVNPRGSSSYGEEFGNLIHHNYPGHDYDDLMSGVDAVLARGYVDPERLFVTGGSGGGVLTSWIVGKTDRFRAAVVAKPVINWHSFALTADFSNFFWRYWFPGYPWDHPDHYHKRSPLSLVGNVVTPTMLLTGDADYRTPMSESEQYYQALKLRKIDTALVRIPGAGHGIARRPSQLVAKVVHILAWFARHDRK